MASFALNNIYNNILTTTGLSTNTRFDTHKKDELKHIYKSIVNQTKDSPLYLFDDSDETKEYAVSLKESARQLKNTISELSNDYSSNLLDKKTASSSDESVVTAKYIGSGEATDGAPSFDIEVKNLARGQENIGRAIPNGDTSLEPDTYSFDIHVNDTDYEFQFVVDEGDNAADIQDKLSRLINRSNIGIKADLIEEDGTTALRLTGTNTGRREDGSLSFLVSDDTTSKRSGAVSYFGLSNVAVEPENAHFLINGNEREAFSNSFTVDRTYELTLLSPSSEGESVHIGIMADIESLAENVNSLVGGYNDFIRRAAEFSANYNKATKFNRELTSLASYYESSLSGLGLSFNEDKSLSVDQDSLKAALQSDETGENRAPLQQFANALLNKTRKISLNPMDYVDKTVVEYKNPGHSFPNPYTTSMYTGMLFNYFC
ncbi:MAG: hypothetical protein K6F99_05880 [Lachnospiraceae bacterium]|nr:hypothetical protein [Lachnospiraceae bacterium]